MRSYEIGRHPYARDADGTWWWVRGNARFRVTDKHADTLEAILETSAPDRTAVAREKGGTTVVVRELEALDADDVRTFLRVLDALRSDGMHLMASTVEHLEALGLEDYADEARTAVRQIKERFSAVAVAGTAYAVRLRQREAAREGGAPCALETGRSG